MNQPESEQNFTVKTLSTDQGNEESKVEEEAFNQDKCLQSLKALLNPHQAEDLEVLVEVLNSKEGKTEDILGLTQNLMDISPNGLELLLDLLEKHPNSNKEIQQYVASNRQTKKEGNIPQVNKHPAEKFFEEFGANKIKLMGQRKIAYQHLLDFSSENPRECYKLFKKYEKTIIEARVELPKIFEVFKLTSISDESLLKIQTIESLIREIEAEASEEKQKMRAIPLNEKLLPDLYLDDESLLDFVLERLKGYSWLSYKKIEVLATSPKETFLKAKKISEKLSIIPISLEEFNIVSFRFTKEEEQAVISTWLNPDSKEAFKISFKELLPLYFNLLKRSEDWEDLTKCVNREIENKGLISDLGFVSRKFLYYLLFIKSDEELRVRILQLYGKYNPVPLVYPQWPGANDTEMKYKINHAAFFLIENSLGIFSCGLGKGAASQIGKSSLLNKIFETKFEINDNTPYSVNTIDIDLDTSFKPSRKICIADAHGHFDGKKYFPSFSYLFKINIIHILASELSRNKLKDELKQFVEYAQSSPLKPKLIFFIRDADSYIPGNEAIYSDKAQIIQLFKDLSELNEKVDLDIHLVKDLSKLDQVRRENVLTLIQKIVLATVNLYENELTFTKENFISNFLSKFDCGNFYQEMNEDIKDLINEIKQYKGNFFDKKIFPMRVLSQQYRETVRILRTTRVEETAHIQKEVQESIEKERKKATATPAIQKFIQMLKKKNSYLIILELSIRLRDFSEQNTASFSDEMNKIKQNDEGVPKDQNLEENKQEVEDQEQKNEKEASNKEDSQAPQNTNIKNLYGEIERRLLSLEIFWREVVSLLANNPSHVLNSLDFNPSDKIYEFLRKGEPLELVDGDNLEFCQNTLNQVFNYYKDDKTAVVCVLGPQSSGKSTLLNYLFGCQFASSVGRCTKGIYCSLLRVTHPYYQYVLILDTEGLQGSEKGDDEFDRKITLFCLAISQLILVNVKGEIHLPMKRLLEICTLSLHELNKSRMDTPEVFFCFNQNAAHTKTGPLAVQIEDMVKSIMDVNPEAKEVAKILPSGEKQENIKLLGFAFQNKAYEKDPQKGILHGWNSFQPISSFANDCSLLAKQILAVFTERAKVYESGKVQDCYSSFQEWSKMADENWKTIDLFPSIYMFSEVKQIKQDRELKDYVTILYQNVSEKEKYDAEEALDAQLKKYDQKLWNRKLLDLIEDTILTDIDQHYKKKNEECEIKLRKIAESNKYDIELTSRHIAHLKTKITALIREQQYNLRSKIQQEVVQLGRQKGLDDIMIKIKEKIEHLKNEVTGQEASDESLTAEFDFAWKAMIAKMKQELNLETLTRNLFQDLFSVYQGCTKLRAYTQNDYEGLIIRPAQDHLIEDCMKRLRGEEVLAFDRTDPMFLEKLEIKLKEDFMFLELSKFYQQKIVLEFFNPFDVMENINYTKLQEKILAQAEIERDDSFKKIRDLLSQFSDFGIFPDQEFMDSLNGILHIGSVGKFFQGIKSRVKQLFEKTAKEKKGIFAIDFFLLKKGIDFQPKLNMQFHDKYPIQRLEVKQDLIAQEKEKLTMCGNFIIQNPKNQYLVRDEYSHYLLSLSFLIDPFVYHDTQAVNMRNNNIKKLIMEEVDWKLFFKILFEEVEGQIRTDKQSLQQDEWKAISSFSKDLMENVARKVIEVSGELNKEIMKLGFKLDMTGSSHIHLIACVLSWKILCDGTSSYLMKPIKEVEEKYETWKEIYISSIQYNPAKITQLNANNFNQSLLKNVQKEALDSVSSALKTHLAEESIKKIFSIKKIQTELDTHYFYQDCSFDEVKNYVDNQNKTIENYFTNEWNKLFEEMKAGQINQYKKDISQPLTEARNAYQKLFDLLNQKEHKKSLDLFETTDIPSDFEERQKYEKLFNKCAAEFFFAFLEGALTNDWDCTVKHEDGTDIKFTFADKNLLENFSSSQLDVYKLSRRDRQLDFSIPFIGDFLQEGLAFFNKQIRDLDKVTPGWTISELKLDNIFNQLKSTSLGCPDACPTCGRKCDREFQHAEVHSCDLGHQIRGMRGIRRGSNHLSNNTCDEINPEDLVEVNGKTIKWGQYTKDFKWQFKCLNEDAIISNRSKYMSCWEKYGKGFSDFYSNHFDIKLFYESKAMIDKSHFLLCLDASGSMEGQRWDSAKRGAQEFVQKLFGLRDYKPTDYAISAIIFSDRVEVEFQYQTPSNILCNNLRFIDGGTDFSKPLKSSIELIQQHTHKYDMHFILFYTDGEASFPQKAIDSINKLPEEVRKRIRFICLCEGANPRVLQQTTDELRKITNGAELHKNISPESLIKKLPEILVSLRS